MEIAKPLKKCRISWKSHMKGTNDFKIFKLNSGEKILDL